MNPIFLLIIAGLCISFSQIINKSLSANNVGSSSLTTTTMLTNAVVSIPLLFVNFYISHNPYIWMLIFFSVVVFALSTYFLFRSYKLVDVSVVSIIQRLNVVFVAIMGILILGEEYTTTSYFGLFLILLGGLVIVYKKQKFKLSKGITFALLVAFFSAIASVSDKVILNDFSPFTYVFVTTPEYTKPLA